MSVKSGVRSVMTVCLLAGVLLSGCRRKDVRVVDILTPGVRNEACARRVSREFEKLRFGIEDVVIHVQTGKITVKYDSMQLGLKNIEMAINEAGFDANDMVADPAAKAALPPECREGVD